MHGYAVLSIAMLAVLAAAGGPAVAQETATAASSNVRFDVYGGIEYRFPADIDGGGDFEQTRVGATLGWRTPLGDAGTTSLGFDMGVLYEGYDFSSAAGLIDAEPWEDIWTARLGLVLRHKIDEEWSIYGGPVVRFAGETDADAEESVDWGGFGGAVWHVNEKLTLGLGCGVMTRIEDDIRVFPIFTLDWRFAERWRLTSESGVRQGVGGFSLSGLEVIWEFADGWELALGGTYEYKRFRLDDEGLAPGGVGQDENFPAWLRLTWRTSTDLDLSLWGGAAFAGALRLEDSGGDRIAEQDYDPAPLIGFSAQVRF